jgi:hypothetical protein
VLLELGRNDIEQFSISAAQLESYTQSISQRYVNAGRRGWCFTVPSATYSNDAWTTLTNQTLPFTVGKIGATAVSSDATQVAMASVANIAVGQSVALNRASNSPVQAIAAGTVVAAVNSGTAAITLSTPTSAAIAAATKLYFGIQVVASAPLEVQRQAYNAYSRAN